MRWQEYSKFTPLEGCYPLNTRAEASDCVVGMTSTCETFTCAGRETTHQMVSAMSSGRSGCAFS